MTRFRATLRRIALPAAVFVTCSLVYAVTLGDRAFKPSPYNHYVHLAHSWLEGQLHVVGDRPPSTNDWACFDTEEHGPCPINRWRFSPKQAERYRWYVSFPPLPAVVLLPFVAVWGTGVLDALIWALLGGLAPAVLFVLLRRLREEDRSGLSLREDLLLTALFAFGTVYFFTAVQGTVWFAAHVVGCALLFAYLHWSIDARRPLLAGLALGLVFLCRPTTALLCIFFGVEALRVSRADADAPSEEAAWYRLVVRWLRAVRWGPALRSAAIFSVPILVLGGVAMWMNDARFEDPFEFGHRYLQINWRGRIEKWGLFNYHYLPRNLAIALASLPWLSSVPPYVTISRHGLALWFTTPNLLLALWPKRMSATVVALWLAAAPVAVLNLMYQNSGWIQFGYRFALDYMPLLFVILALSGRRFRLGFVTVAVLAIAINAFGAVTFDRVGKFYDTDMTQRVVFQPD